MSENGCEFCRKPYKSIDSGKGGKEKSILYIGGNSPYAQLSKQYLHYMDVVGRMDLFEVKFCPICGREVEGEHMNADEIARLLRSNTEVNPHAAIMLAAADEINRLQSELGKLNKRIADEGFSDLGTMISKYKIAMLAANELSIETDEEVEALKSEIEKWKVRHNQAAQNWQQENQECQKLVAQLDHFRDAAEKVSMNEIKYAIANLKDFLDLGQGDLQPTSVELAITALRSELDRGGCEYCKFTNHTTDTDYGKPLGLDGANDSIVLETNGMDCGITSDSWEVIINYCPMCGKKLREDKMDG